MTVKKIIEKDIVIKPRAHDSSKADYGRVRVMGGSACMPGAAVLAATAASRAGAGLVTLGVPLSMAAAFQARALETMLYFFGDDGGFAVFDKAAAAEFCDKADVVAVGPGMGKNYAEIRKFISYFLTREITLIIDADGLNALQGHTDILSVQERKAQVIMTPHIVEFSRLINNPDIESVKADRLALVKDFAARHKVVLLLKGHETLITDGSRAYIGADGTPALAKGGSGDVLTGIIAGLAANYPPFEAAYYGVYFLGEAAQAAEKERGENSVLASDIVDKIKIV